MKHEASLPTVCFWNAANGARTRPSMRVSMPVNWEQLHELKSGAQWKIAAAREYLGLRQVGPWARYWKKQ